MVCLHFVTIMNEYVFLSCLIYLSDIAWTNNASKYINYFARQSQKSTSRSDVLLLKNNTIKEMMSNNRTN